MKKLILFTICGFLMLSFFSINAQELYWEENGTTSTTGTLAFIDAADVNNISTNTTDWVNNAGNIANQALTTVTALSLTGYPNSGTGNGFRTSTQNASGAFKSNNIEYIRRLGNGSGAQTIYLAVIMNVFQVRAESSAFPIGFAELINNDANPSAISRTWAARLLIDNTGGTTNDKDGSYQFGLTKNGTDRFFDTNKTYTADGNSLGDAAVFVVIKLTTDGDDTNGGDMVELYTSTSFPASEPSTYDLSVTTGDDENVNAVFLREKMDTNGAGQDHFVNMSNIRVADSWDGLFASIYTGSWSLGEPTASMSGIVDADLTLSTDLTSNNLTVTSGNTLTVNSGAALDIQGDLTTDGILSVNSGGTLLTYDGNTSGAVIYKRNSSFTDMDNQYSFIGSPVAGMEISELGADFHFTYNTIDDTYSSFSGVMEAGKGYTSAGKQALAFVGVPNSGTINVTLDNSGNGFNFVANPFPAAISRADFVSGNSNIDGTVYLWDDGGSDEGQRTSADFVTVNNAGTVSGGSSGSGASFNGFIGAAQGFFVKASSVGDVTFTEAMRDNGNNGDGNFYRSEIPLNSIKLNVQTKDSRDETLIAFSEEGTSGFDRMWDAEKIIVNDELAISTLLSDDRELAIQTLPGLNQVFDFIEIPLMISVSKQSEVVFSLADIQISDEFTVSLVDRFDDVSFPMNRDIHLTVTARDQKRYALKIARSSVILSVDDKVYQTSVFTDENMGLNFHVPAITGEALLTIFDLNGREICNSPITFDSKGRALYFPADATEGGMYISKIKQGGKSFTTKFILPN